MSQLFSARDTWTVLTIHTILLHQRLGRMLSVGYHLLVLLQRPQQQQEQQQHVLLRHRVLLPEEERSCFPRRRDGKECRPYTHNDTKVLIRHLHKTRHHIIFYACGDLLKMHRTNVAGSGG